MDDVPPSAKSTTALGPMELSTDTKPFRRPTLEHAAVGDLLPVLLLNLEELLQQRATVVRDSSGRQATLESQGALESALAASLAIHFIQ